MEGLPHLKENRINLKKKSTTFRGFGTERARLSTFRGFGTERARLGIFRGFGTEHARLGTFRGFLIFFTNCRFFNQEKKPVQNMKFCMKN